MKNKHYFANNCYSLSKRGENDRVLAKNEVKSYLLNNDIIKTNISSLVNEKVTIYDKLNYGIKATLIPIEYCNDTNKLKKLITNLNIYTNSKLNFESNRSVVYMYVRDNINDFKHSFGFHYGGSTNQAWLKRLVTHKKDSYGHTATHVLVFLLPDDNYKEIERGVNFIVNDVLCYPSCGTNEGDDIILSCDDLEISSYIIKVALNIGLSPDYYIPSPKGKVTKFDSKYPGKRLVEEKYNRGELFDIYSLSYGGGQINFTFYVENEELYIKCPSFKNPKKYICGKFETSTILKMFEDNIFIKTPPANSIKLTDIKDRNGKYIR